MYRLKFLAHIYIGYWADVCFLPRKLSATFAPRFQFTPTKIVLLQR